MKKNENKNKNKKTPIGGRLVLWAIALAPWLLAGVQVVIDLVWVRVITSTPDGDQLGWYVTTHMGVAALATALLRYGAPAVARLLPGLQILQPRPRGSRMEYDPAVVFHLAFSGVVMFLFEIALGGWGDLAIQTTVGGGVRWALVEGTGSLSLLMALAGAGIAATSGGWL